MISEPEVVASVMSAAPRSASRVSVELGPAAITYFTEEELSQEETELEATAESIVDTTILQAVCYLNQVGVLAEKAHSQAMGGDSMCRQQTNKGAYNGDQLRRVIRELAAENHMGDQNKNVHRLSAQPPKANRSRGGQSPTPFRCPRPLGPTMEVDDGAAREEHDRRVMQPEGGMPSATTRSGKRVVVAETKLCADLASFTADPAPNVDWPKNADFSQDAGVDCIHDYVATWHRSDKWTYCIDFVQRQPTQYGDKYIYQVRWSVPTQEAPIPSVTASTYFTMHVSRVQPEGAQVQVTFQMESNRMVHVPGQSRFCEKWLQDIIDSKLILMHTLSAAAKKG